MLISGPVFCGLAEKEQNNLYSYWLVGFGLSVIAYSIFIKLVNSCLCRVINISIRINSPSAGFDILSSSWV